jgi:hypothetical protein
LAFFSGLTGVGLKSYFQLQGRTAISACPVELLGAAFHVTVLLQNEDGFLKMTDTNCLGQVPQGKIPAMATRGDSMNFVASKKREAAAQYVNSQK